MKIIRNILLFSCAILFVAGFYKNNIARADAVEKKCNFEHCVLESYVSKIRTGIVRLIYMNRSNEKDLSPLYKINYSLPGTQSYDPKSKFGLFSPSGAQVNVEEFSKLSDNPVFIFTFGNRVKDLFTAESELMFLMPAMHADFCYSFESKVNGNTNIASIQEINIDPAPKEVPKDKIVELPNKAGCVKVKDDYYFYRTLLER